MKIDHSGVEVDGTPHDVTGAEGLAERLERPSVRLFPRAPEPERVRVRAQRVQRRRDGAPSAPNQSVITHGDLEVMAAAIDDADGGARARPLRRGPGLRQREAVREVRRRVVHGEERGAVVDAHAHRRSPVGGRVVVVVVVRRRRRASRRSRGGRVAEGLVDDLQHRHAERAGLPAARLRRREHVPAAEDQRHRLGLHRGGQEPAGVVGGTDQLGAHAQLLERRHVEPAGRELSGRGVRGEVTRGFGPELRTLRPPRARDAAPRRVR